jgi:hypothetical protein
MHLANSCSIFVLEWHIDEPCVLGRSAITAGAAHHFNSAVLARRDVALAYRLPSRRSRSEPRAVARKSMTTRIRAVRLKCATRNVTSRCQGDVFLKLSRFIALRLATVSPF